MARDLEARGARPGGREEIAERPREARRIFEKGVVPDPGHLQERRVRPGAQNRAQFFGRRERIARPGHEEKRHRRPLQPFGERSGGEDAVHVLLGGVRGVLPRGAGPRRERARDEAGSSRAVHGEAITPGGFERAFGHALQGRAPRHRLPLQAGDAAVWRRSRARPESEGANAIRRESRHFAGHAAAERVTREQHGLLADLAEDPARERSYLVARARPRTSSRAREVKRAHGEVLCEELRRRGPILSRTAEAVQEDERSLRLLRRHRGESYLTGRGAVVAHLLWEQGVAGSIPAAPTISRPTGGPLRARFARMIFTSRRGHCAGQNELEYPCPSLLAIPAH